MRYKIWKAGIEEYRILDTQTNTKTVYRGFTTVGGCKLMVDEDKYNLAKANNFENSGDEDDYFAWIECNKLTPYTLLHYSKVMFYNPFKHAYFRDKSTLEVLHFVYDITAEGNYLTYFKG